MDSINLLPPELRSDRPVQWNSLMIKVFVIMLIIFFIVSSLMLFLKIWWLEYQLNTIADQMLDLQPSRIKMREVEDKIEKLEKEKIDLEEIMHTKNEWSMVLTQINEALTAGNWLLSIATKETGQILVQGQTQSLVALGQMTHLLTENKIFTNVKLMRIEPNPDNQETKLFEIEMFLNN